MTSDTFAGRLEEQFRAAVYVRSAVIEAAKGYQLGEAQIGAIVAMTTDDLTAAGGGGLRSPAERIRLAATLAQQYIASAKPLNFLSATPQEIEAQKIALGMPFGGGRDGPLSSQAYRRELASSKITDPGVAEALGISGETAARLSGLGYTSAAQVGLLIGDARFIGLDPNMSLVALGTLKRFDAANYAGHVQFFQSYRQGHEEVRDLREQAGRETDPAKKAELERRAREREQKLEEERQKRRDKIRDPKAQEAFDRLAVASRNSAQLRREHGTDGPTAARNKTAKETKAHLSSAERKRIEAEKEAALVRSQVRTEEKRTAALDDDVWGGGGTTAEAAPKSVPPTQVAADRKVKQTPEKPEQEIADTGLTQEIKPDKPMTTARSAKAPAPNVV